MRFSPSHPLFTLRKPWSQNGIIRLSLSCPFVELLHPLIGKGACIFTPRADTYKLPKQPFPLTSYKKASLQPDQAQEDVFGLSFCKSPAQSISKGAAGFILNAPHRNAVMFGINNHSHVGRA